MVSSSGMPVPLKTDLRFPITGQQGHESWNIHEWSGFIFAVRDKRQSDSKPFSLYRDSKLNILVR